MIEVEFDIQVTDTPQEEPLFDTYEMDMMLAHTKEQMLKQVEASLGAMRCAQHDQPPKVRISGKYSLQTEQLEVVYNIDTCCNTFLMQSIRALNRA
ncbi:MAG: hypothetical protein OHK0046_36360 [Anaerolineae bacterium]